MSPTHSPEQSGAGLSAGAHADLLKLPAIRHCGDHLGQLLLLALQHPVNMLGGHLLVDEGGSGGGESYLKRDMRSNVVVMIKEHITNSRKHKTVRIRPPEKGHVMQFIHEANPYLVQSQKKK